MVFLSRLVVTYSPVSHRAFLWVFSLSTTFLRTLRLFRGRIRECEVFRGVWVWVLLSLECVHAFLPDLWCETQIKESLPQSRPARLPRNPRSSGTRVHPWFGRYGGTDDWVFVYLYQAEMRYWSSRFGLWWRNLRFIEREYLFFSPEEWMREEVIGEWDKT